MKITTLTDLNILRDKGLKKILPHGLAIGVGLGTCGSGNGAQEVFEQFAIELKRKNLKAQLKPLGCFGYCAKEPLVNIHVPGKPLLIFAEVTPQDVPGILAGVKTGKFPKAKILCKIEKWDHLTGVIEYGPGYPDIPNWSEVPFYQGQLKLVLRDCGLIDPHDIEEYIGIGGYFGLFNILHDLSQDKVIQEVKNSKLRGRGGAGFPTGLKWELMKKVPSDQKYVICNADEGDPGAYMNRNEIEGDPHMLIEGMAIGAYAMGAHEGIVYIRAEYPLAVKRLQAAIEQAREHGFLGKNIFKSGFNFDIHLVEGAGAFVCGEETALIASIEGKAGRPKPRPPFPAEKGLYGKPTNINNVETWSNIPVIFAKGSEWFAKVGTEKSTGTKVFSLVGKVKNTGLVEMPMGTPLADIIYGIGEGTGTRKKVKAVQTGGPSGGCIPAKLFQTTVDYESLTALGAIMGSGGMVVMDDDNCMVDVARYFLEFTTSESCGKCVPCREGLVQQLNILKKITRGQGTEQDLETLALLSRVIKDSALCGLGQTGPNPVLTTMQYFMTEYQEHIKNKHCRAGVCQELFISPCENSCPLHMNIPGYLELYKEKKLLESFESILRDNPLPAALGRICHFHCKMRCRREDVDKPILQGEVHRYISDTVYDSGKEAAVYKKLIEEKFTATGKKIAIVGAGPAGLTAAYYLVRLGHNVTIYDKLSEAGGILRWGIPAYRLPRPVLAKEIAFIKKLGVKFVLDTEIGKTISLKTLENKFDKIFCAIGAEKTMDLGIPGEQLKGVIQGQKLLEQVAAGKKVSLGKKTVVIGGGNVAIDAARTALRLGTDVTIAYRRDRNAMPANEHEIASALQEKVKLEYFAAPKSIKTKKGVVVGLEVDLMQPGIWDASGRKKPVPTGETKVIPCNTVILAIGEKVEADLWKKIDVEINSDQTVAIDIRTFQTNNPKVHAGGDVVMGPATAAEAMAQGKWAAEEIDRELVPLEKNEKSRFERLFKKFDYANKVPIEPEGGKGSIPAELPVTKRVKNFSEVTLGLTPPKALAEACRCLRCDVKGE